ncbi:membrane bound O-acyl transferase family-domain-containing protein [Whalleya microplaca]|nr:membrane bound O-acyl transferase family-domain-containing protein [Whalleya microplaca]
MDYHPLFDSFAVVLLTAIIIGFTSAFSFLRVASLPILSALTWHCLLNCPAYIPRSSWASAVGGYTLFSLLHYLDVAVLTRWSFELQGPMNDLIRGTSQAVSPRLPNKLGRKEARLSDIICRLKFGFSVFFSWRFVNTPYQVKHLPQLDENLRSSRVRFLTHTALTVVFCYLVLDAMDSSSDINIAEKFYSLDKIGLLSRIQDVSLEELIMRLFAAVGLGVGLIAFQRGVYSIAAFVCVAVGLNAPEDWPPFNGPIHDIRSLRYFWSTFWHQINTHRLNIISKYLIYNVLRLRRGSRIVRYTRVWLIFVISGIWHVAIDFSSGIPARESGAFRFFCIQPLGIVIEDVIGSVYQVDTHYLGFIWVCV